MTPKTLSLALLASLFAALPTAAAVSIFPSAGGSSAPVLPGSRVVWTIGVYRAIPSSPEATGVSLTIPLPDVMTNVSAAGDGWTCSTTSSLVVCNASLAAAANSTPLRLAFDTPSSADGGRFSTVATLGSSVPNTHPNTSAQIVVNVYRTFTVTTADDFGAGSLRDAITRANERCDNSVSCLMTFAGPMTIEPQSTLPSVTACDLTIDGGLAQGTSQDVEHPVEISGVKAGVANGLELRSWCGVRLRGVTVNGFAANGIVLATGQAPKPVRETLFVEDCFIGTDTKASQARPNGMRGISLETPATVASIRNSTISGNRYSGVAVWAAALVDIGGCRIGAGRDLRPLGNGASGVFINSGRVSINGTVAYNHDFGVAVGPDAGDVNAGMDGLFANGGLDYDWGLDGANRDRFGHMPPVPELIDAAYDPARNMTIIRGVFPALGRRTGSFLYTIRIFALAAGHYVAQWSQTNFFALASGDQPFTMSVSGDLRGRSLVGQSFFYQWADLPPYDSSEVSLPVVAH